jgi:hypothetical protein
VVVVEGRSVVDVVDLALVVVVVSSAFLSPVVPQAARTTDRAIARTANR